MKKIYFYLGTLLIAPVATYAAAATDLNGLMNLLIGLLGKLMSLFYAAAFAAFFWGIAKFIWGDDKDKDRTAGKEWMKWAIIALFVMVTLWGIVGVLTRTFGLSGLVIPQLGK